MAKYGWIPQVAIAGIALFAGYKIFQALGWIGKGAGSLAEAITGAPGGAPILISTPVTPAEEGLRHPLLQINGWEWWGFGAEPPREPVGTIYPVGKPRYPIPPREPLPLIKKPEPIAAIQERRVTPAAARFISREYGYEAVARRIHPTEPRTGKYYLKDSQVWRFGGR
jgi:hypothetical protein